jgi:hypothetical protein
LVLFEVIWLPVSPPVVVFVEFVLFELPSPVL